MFFLLDLRFKFNKKVFIKYIIKYKYFFKFKKFN